MNTSQTVERDDAELRAIKEISQKKFFTGARELNNYIQSIERLFITPKGDTNTNIIDQGSNKTFNFPCISDLCNHLNACRIEGTIMHYSEKQIEPCGLMLDFDIITSNREITLYVKLLRKLTKTIFKVLNTDIDLDIKHTYYTFYTTRPSIDKIEEGKYKYGFHILIPGIRLDKIYKKWFLQKIKENESLMSVLEELNVININECVDQNSASVPVLFLGSCKASSSTPYILSYGFDITWSDGYFEPEPIVLEKYESEYNLVAELSLNAEAIYNNKSCLIKKIKYEYKPGILLQLENKNIESKTSSDDDILNFDHSISTLTMHNPEADYLYKLLDILPEEYYTDRNKWRDIIYALANASNEYKPLAIQFSQKCKEKWEENGQNELDALWDSPKSNNPITIASISYWAQISNPDKYKSIMEQSYFKKLLNYLYMSGGKLQHYMIAKVLHIMLHNKFCTDIDNGNRCKWYEFVISGEPMMPGEIWKWREEVEPTNLQIYISEKLITVFEKITDHIELQKEQSQTEAQLKYYKTMETNFTNAKLNMYNNTFKSGIIKEASGLFRHRNFIKSLDTIPNLFGVGNGVLELGTECKLIDYYHEYPVSRYTHIKWTKFNPENEMTKVALKAISEIIIEDDVRNWILFHAAQGLSRSTKEGLMLLFEGGGQNGKTTFLRWIAKALGPYADKFNINLLACQREEADRPNSAIMKLKYINWAYSEESNKGEVLNVARMKELVNAGEISGRDLNSKQETFTIKCNFVVASQYTLTINTTDHGTWRRIRHYTSKTKFCSNPDPNNPYEKKDDQKFNITYTNDENFLSSILSILTHYYERLQKEYDGQLKNVPCPRLDIETETFRMSQDAIHRWICECVVISPDNDTQYDIGTVTVSYLAWYKIHIDNKAVITSNTIIKEITSSVLNKYLVSAPNKSLILKGCRILGTETTLQNNEEYISVKESYKEKQTVEYKKDWWNY